MVIARWSFSKQQVVKKFLLTSVVRLMILPGSNLRYPKLKLSGRNRMVHDDHGISGFIFLKFSKQIYSKCPAEDKYPPKKTNMTMENHHFKVIVHCHVSFRGCKCIEMSLDDGTHVSSEMQHPTCSWTNMKVNVHIGFHGFWLASRQPVVASFWNCWKNMGIQFHTMTYRFQSSLDGRCPIWQTFFQVPWSTTQDGSFYMTRVLCFFSPNSLYQWWIGRLSPHNLPKAFNPKVVFVPSVCAVNFGQSVKIHQEIHTTQRFWRFRRYVCSRYIYIYTHINK